MSETEPAALVVGALGALLAVALFVGTSVAAWRRLARVYPDSPLQAEHLFSGISGQIGGTYGSVGGCIRVSLGLEGVRISLWPQWLWPPFMIPWSDITSCERARYYFSPVGIRIAIARWPEPIYLWPRLWRDEILPDKIRALWRERASKVG